MNFENFLAAFLFTYNGWAGIENWLHYSLIILVWALTATPIAAIVWPVIGVTVVNENWLQWRWLRQMSRRVATVIIALAAGWILLPAIAIITGLAAVIGIATGLFRLFRPRRNRGGSGNNR